MISLVAAVGQASTSSVCAAWKRAASSDGIRPRSLTFSPLPRAHSRMAWDWARPSGGRLWRRGEGFLGRGVGALRGGSTERGKRAPGPFAGVLDKSDVVVN